MSDLETAELIKASKARMATARLNATLQEERELYESIKAEEEERKAAARRRAHLREVEEEEENRLMAARKAQRDLEIRQAVSPTSAAHSFSPTTASENKADFTPSKEFTPAREPFKPAEDTFHIRFSPTTAPEKKADFKAEFTPTRGPSENDNIASAWEKTEYENRVVFVKNDMNGHENETVTPIGGDKRKSAEDCLTVTARNEISPVGIGKGEFLYRGNRQLAGRRCNLYTRVPQFWVRFH